MIKIEIGVSPVSSGYSFNKNYEETVRKTFEIVEEYILKRLDDKEFKTRSELLTVINDICEDEIPLGFSAIDMNNDYIKYRYNKYGTYVYFYYKQAWRDKRLEYILE